MALTRSTDLYAPEVWEDLAQDSFEGKAILALGPGVVTDNALEGVPGDTVNFPSWMNLTDLDDLTEGVPMTTEKLTQKNRQATIKEAGKAVELTDTAKLTGIGNAQDEAIRQFGILSARKVDGDLITEAQAVVADGITYADGSAATASAPLTFAPTAAAKLGWDFFVDATAPFGDELEPSDFAGIYINSAQRAELFKDDDFVRADGKAGNDVIRRGQIGDLGGIAVFVTNRITAGKFLIVKNSSLGLLYKRRPIVEMDRDILARTDLVTTNMHYATKRLNDRGVLVASLAPMGG